MRPGLTFIGLFAFLILIYWLTRDSLSTFWISVLQLGIVLMLLGLFLFFRYSRKQKGWFFFREDEVDEEQPNTKPPAQHKDEDQDKDERYRKAS